MNYAETDLVLIRRISRDFDHRARGLLVLSYYIEAGSASRIVLGPIDQPVRNVRGRIAELLR